MRKSFHKILDGSNPVRKEQFEEYFQKYRLLVFRNFPRERLESFLHSLGTFRNQSLSGNNYFKALNYPAKTGDSTAIGVMPWHHDCPFLDPAPAAVALYCEQPSEVGGETDWLDLSQVWECLPVALKDPLRSLDVIHKASCFEKYVHFPYDPKAFKTPDEQALYVDSLASRRPLVRRDDWRNVEYVYCSEGYTDRFVPSECPSVEGAPNVSQRSEIFQSINEFSESCLYRHEWQKGDLAIADNQSLSHRRWPWPASSGRAMIRAQIFL